MRTLAGVGCRCALLRRVLLLCMLLLHALRPRALRPRVLRLHALRLRGLNPLFLSHRKASCLLAFVLIKPCLLSCVCFQRALK